MKRSSWHRFLTVILLLICTGITSGIFWGTFAGIDDSSFLMLIGIAVITFVLAIANLMAITGSYGIKVRGYEGIVHRVLKAPGLPTAT